MAIVDKQYSAFLVKRLSDDTGQGLPFIWSLVYHPSKTTPDEIQTLYPDLHWDEVISALLFSDQLGVALPGWPSPDIDVETAMLDTTFYDGTSGGPGIITGNWGFSSPLHADMLVYSLDWRNSLGGYVGLSPGALWAEFPDNGTLAETTPTPFGAFGNGLIRYEMLNWGSGPSTIHWFGGGPPFTNHTAANWTGNGIPPYSPPVAPAPNDDQIAQAYFNSITYIFTPVEGPDPPTPATSTVRAWTFTQDDHDFYVLQPSSGGTYVFDKLSEQWSQWKSPDEDYWRGADGCSWQGFNVCCDTDSSKVWTIDPEGRLDYGTTPITSIIFAGLTERFRTFVPCYMAELAVSEGQPPSGIDPSTVGIQLRSGDGRTWYDHGIVPGEAVGDNVTVRWYGIGLMQSPGMVFEITDTGYARCISGFTIETGTFDIATKSKYKSDETTF